MSGRYDFVSKHFKMINYVKTKERTKTKLDSVFLCNSHLEPTKGEKNIKIQKNNFDVAWEFC